MVSLQVLYINLWGGGGHVLGTGRFFGLREYRSTRNHGTKRILHARLCSTQTYIYTHSTGRKFNAYLMLVGLIKHIYQLTKRMKSQWYSLLASHGVVKHVLSGFILGSYSRLALLLSL